MSESAEKQELPPDERLRRMEGHLQYIKMLLTQLLTKLNIVSGKPQEDEIKPKTKTEG